MPAQDHLDRIDFELLQLLQDDAWLSLKKLAARVNLAGSSVHERLKQLRARGVLRGAHADVDPQLLGLGLEAVLMIELSKHDRALVDQILADIAEIPEVRSAHLVSGRYDLIVNVVVRDMRALKDLALDQFTNRPGVTRIETSVAFDVRRRWILPTADMTAAAKH